MNRAFIFISILLCMLLTSQANANNETLKLVLNNLSKIKHIEASFKDIKIISLFDKKSVLTGNLEYIAPDVLVRRTLKPQKEIFKVKGDNLYLKNSTGKELELLVSSYPLIEMFVEAYRGILSGDLIKLQNFYNIDFKGNPEQWIISLVPIDDDGLEYIEEIIVNGHKDDVVKFTTIESSGDMSILNITKK